MGDRTYRVTYDGQSRLRERVAELEAEVARLSDETRRHAVGMAELTEELADAEAEVARYRGMIEEALRQDSVQPIHEALTRAALGTGGE